ncbi:MAG: tetratricopeptide repeat protein [Candidatus Riflebacteria bacterium]|nr:tetratricopeptide repeat protein [Candidatus Riflebacteria bacterium]
MCISFALLLMLISPLPVNAQIYLIGEDAPATNNLVISVNSIERKQFTGGLAAQNKQDQIEISMTFVNIGSKSITITPSEDFSLTILHKFLPENDKKEGFLFNSFTLPPGTQSRGKLAFKVAADEVHPAAILSCTNETIGSVEINCDLNISKIFEKNKSTPLDLNESLILGKFLIDSNRKAEAEKFLMGSYTRFGDDPQLLVLLATLSKESRDITKASEYVSRIAPESNTGKTESLQIAKDAFNLGQFEICAKMLEPLYEKQSLEDKELLILGRCWYFQKDYERAKEILSEIESRQFVDSQLYFTLANINDKLDDLPSAIHYWEKTLETDPNHYESMFNIGVAHYKQKDLGKAKEYWEKTLELNPDEQTKEIIENALKSLQ